MQAATASDLIPAAPARPLVVAQWFALPYSKGKSLQVVIGLSPGAPGQLPVPTELEYLRFAIALAADGVFLVTERPSRADLVTAATRALADEAQAITAAEAALVRAKVTLPASSSSWKAALRRATYDSRLPAGRQFGEPTWNFIFDPWTDRGFNSVLLDQRLGVIMVNGKPLL